MIVPIDLLLLFFLLIVAIAALWVRDLLAAIVLTGAYSFIMANVWLQLGACDVAFTEASILDFDTLSEVTRGVDSVVHLGAIGSVPRSVANPRASHRCRRKAGLSGKRTGQRLGRYGSVTDLGEYGRTG